MNIELTPAAKLLIHVLGKLRAQRDALLSTVATQMVQHAQQLMNQAGASPRNLIGNAWRTSWSMFPRTEAGESGRLLEALVGRLVDELEQAIVSVEERVPRGVMPVSPPLPTSLRDLDDLFALAGTRPNAQTLSHEEGTEASLFARVFHASMVGEAFRRILSAYRFEVGDFDRADRAERLFCDLAAIALPHLECYHEDLLVHDRDAIYGMSVGQEGLVVVKSEGYGTWFYPTVGALQNVPMDPKRSLMAPRAIALITYDSVTQLSADAADRYWRKATHRAHAA